MSEKILVGTRKGLFTLIRGKSRWTIDKKIAFLADNVSMVLPDGRDGSTYAALNHGHFGVKLHYHAGGRKKWEEITPPALPKRPEGEAPQIDFFGRPMPDSVQLIWGLEAADPRTPGTLWCGTIPGGLFHSKDFGRSWELVRSLWDHPKRKGWTGGGADYPGIHSICVDPTDHRKVAVGVSTGGVWATENNGESWEIKSHGMRADYMPPDLQMDPHHQDVHRLVQCQGQPSGWWAQHHNGVFRSTDGSKSWHEIKIPPSSFGFAVVVHPKDANTAWFVPGVSDQRRIPVDGKVIATRTRDGGKSFESLEKGLPQKHAYDITYRHCLDLDAGGNQLVFGTTTGSVWVSEDQGDSWKAVSEHLPPIYCVRFVP